MGTHPSAQPWMHTLGHIPDRKPNRWPLPKKRQVVRTLRTVPMFLLMRRVGRPYQDTKRWRRLVLA